MGLIDCKVSCDGSRATACVAKGYLVERELEGSLAVVVEVSDKDVFAWR